MGKETAEQKLLKLIEQGDDDGAQGQPAGDAQSEQPVNTDAQKALDSVRSFGGGGGIALPVGAGRLFDQLKRLIIGDPSEGFGVHQINRILLISVIVMAGYFGLQLSQGMKAAGRRVNFELPSAVAFKGETLLPQFAEVKQYLQAVAKRNIFNPYELKEVETVAEKTVEQKRQERVSQKVQDLKLVGVSWLETADTASVMIENTASGVTYFLKVGDEVNGVKVAEIFADSVVMEMDGERTEMRL
ncbi:MAG: hypothetical protein ACLFPX_02720 [Candidatus Omnitrophota bacterium]